MRLNGIFNGGFLASLRANPEPKAQATTPSNVTQLRQQDAVQISHRPARPPLAKMMAVGGMMATCVAGAVTLGPMGAFLGLAGQALAFAAGFLMNSAEHCELKKTNKELLKKATTDALTGLRNRSAVFDILEDELERCEWHGTELSIILGDIDHFKSINDTYGHPAGDAVLTEVARRLAKSVRNVDSPGRYGGEEMMVVLPGASTECALEVAERIRKEICATPVDTIWGRIPVTMSLGVAGTDTVGCPMLMLLIQAADQALYQAKDEGRDRVISVA